MMASFEQSLKASFEQSLKACSNKANIVGQHHSTLLDATCWPHLNTMPDDVG